MKTVIEMAREAGINMTPAQFSGVLEAEIDEFQLERFEALVRADERKNWQKWFDAVTAQHKQLILAEREACAKLVEDAVWFTKFLVAKAIRARGNT